MEKQHTMTSHGGAYCSCGEWLYEDNHGHVFCTVGGQVERYSSDTPSKGTGKTKKSDEAPTRYL